MPLLRSKKFLFLLLLGFALLLVALAVIFLFNQKTGVKNMSGDITKTAQKYDTYFNQDQIQETLSILNNAKLSSEERYRALYDITFYFSTAYSASHDPSLRTYVLSLKDFAKKTFPKDYREGDFSIPCADPVCGEKPDIEFEQIKQEVKNSGIDPLVQSTIFKNLDQTGYIPRDEVDDKTYGFKLVISQLEFENNAKASAAAQHLRNYAKKKYAIDL